MGILIMTKIKAIRKAVDDTYVENKHKPIPELYRIWEEKLNENGYKIVEK